MQGKVYKYVEKVVADNNINGEILDVGALYINGSVKDIFKDSKYTGLDMRDGKNVDVVANGHAIPFEDETFDCVTCVETLEHDDDPFQTLREINRVLKMNGWCILAASGINFHKHSYPDDFWRFTDSGIKVLLKEFKNVETKDDSNEAYGFGQK